MAATGNAEQTVNTPIAETPMDHAAADVCALPRNYARGMRLNELQAAANRHVARLEQQCFYSELLDQFDRLPGLEAVGFNTEPGARRDDPYVADARWRDQPPAGAGGAPLAWEDLVLYLADALDYLALDLDLEDELVGQWLSREEAQRRLDALTR